MRKIRTKFLYQHKKNGGKVLAVTSTVPEEGKTTLAVNLAIALAQDEKKVLLIQGDIRRDCLRQYLDLKSDKSKSWGRCLAEGGNLEDTIRPGRGAGVPGDAERREGSALLGSSDAEAAGRVSGIHEGKV